MPGLALITHSSWILCQYGCQLHLEGQWLKILKQEYFEIQINLNWVEFFLFLRRKIFKFCDSYFRAQLKPEGSMFKEAWGGEGRRDAWRSRTKLRGDCSSTCTISGKGTQYVVASSKSVWRPPWLRQYGPLTSVDWLKIFKLLIQNDQSSIPNISLLLWFSQKSSYLTLSPLQTT